MSGMLHPVGPETPGTYWARRVLVLGAATVLAVAVVLIIGGTSIGSAAQPSFDEPGVFEPDVGDSQCGGHPDAVLRGPVGFGDRDDGESEAEGIVNEDTSQSSGGLPSR
jgi:hypothetical protein